MRRAIGIVTVGVGFGFLAGCAEPVAPTFDEDQLRANNLRTYWTAQLPLDPDERVSHCHAVGGQVYYITTHAAVFAVDATAGTIAWSRQLGSIGNVVFEPTVSLGSGVDQAVVLTSQEGVWVVERQSGKLMARIPVSFAPGGPAVASDELAWCGDLHGNMHAVLPDGDDLWRVQTGSAIVAGPILFPDRVIFSSTDGYVYCARPVTKQQLWSFEAQGQVRARPAHNDDFLFVPSMNRYCYCVQVDTGELVWQYRAPEPLGETPSLTQDTVYLSCGDAGLVALDMGTGTQRWQREQARGFVSQDRDTAYVMDASGFLAALDNRDGREKWTYWPLGADFVAPNEEDSGMFWASRNGSLRCVRRLDTPYLRRAESSKAPGAHLATASTPTE